jgi:hypothetical protein
MAAFTLLGTGVDDAPSLTEFWKGLGATISDHHDVLKLPDRVYMFGKKSLGSTMYLRSSYKDIWAQINKYFEDPWITTVGILGKEGNTLKQVRCAVIHIMFCCATPCSLLQECCRLPGYLLGKLLQGCF